MRTQRANNIPSTIVTPQLRTEYSARCVETTGQPEPFRNGGSTPSARDREQISRWLAVEVALGDNTSAVNRVRAALISGEVLHSDGLSWLLTKIRKPGLCGDLAVKLLNEFSECGQIVRAA